MTAHWPAVSYDRWAATCDTLHAHTQVLGKLAVELAPPQPELLHAALRLTARGFETGTLPAPDGSGSLVVALDLHAHEAVVEHSRGSVERVPLTPDRPVAEVTRDVLAAVARAGGAVRINPKPQEVPWSVPLDEDYEHTSYDPGRVEEYFAAATQAALALAAFRAPYRGRSTPVNAWWGSFDLGVLMFSGAPADPRSNGFITRNADDAQQIGVGWWPGGARQRAASCRSGGLSPLGLSSCLSDVRMERRARCHRGRHALAYTVTVFRQQPERVRLSRGSASSIAARNPVIASATAPEARLGRS
jgi:hypothetical protein